MRNLFSCALCFLLSSYLGFGQQASGLIMSHGPLSRIAVHAIPNNKFCQTGVQIENLRKQLHSAFGADKVCMINHMVVPNWKPKASKGFTDAFGRYWCISKGDCDLAKLFPNSYSLYGVWRKQKLALRWSNKRLIDDAFGGDGYKKRNQLKGIMKGNYDSLLKSLESEFVTNFDATVENPDNFECTDVDPVARFRNNYCTQHNLKFCDCLCRYSKNLDRYIQDFFLVERTQAGSKFIQTWLDGSEAVGDHTEYLKKQCSDCETSNVQQSDIWFEGGDILVSEKFVLIGKNILIKYLLPSKATDAEANRISALQRIGMNPNSRLTIDAIEQLKVEISNRLFSGKKVLFVGHEDRVFSNTMYTQDAPRYNSYQPAYHLDLFLALIGEKSEGQFTVLIAEPNIAYYADEMQKNAELRAMITKMSNNIGVIKNQLLNFLKDSVNGIDEVVFVPVPMLFTLKKSSKGKFTVYKHFSFINGVSFEKDNTFSFAYSDYIDDSQYRGVQYKSARTDLEDSLKGAGIIPYRVSSSYGKSAGLHCTSKVLER
jgi:hypothetical protein